ncbi:Hypothetical protein LUCI_0352 [Lucifera butyrica]|uniref:Uncharacterized protein n=1 Tax=Lucifera butyrica TaxID=1351585 RepID=A0A498R1V9_9FIRM|nr:hypothetical protein [Lucifera butyrica]VBB05145.1 Hypothetical protein LUCI_0352 [Lucifera butyrica]
MTLLLILAGLLTAVYEGLPLFRKRLWRELAILGLLLGSAGLLGIVQVLGLSTPLNWLEQILGPVGRQFFK